VSVKLKLAFVEFVRLAGALVIEGVGGAVVSIAHVDEVIELSLPAEFLAKTWNVWEPSDSPE
jgi:hypothetical protein